jgi:hypothetical protein
MLHHSLLIALQYHQGAGEYVSKVTRDLKINPNWAWLLCSYLGASGGKSSRLPHSDFVHSGRGPGESGA